MFNLWRNAKSKIRPAQPRRESRTVGAPEVKYAFVATFNGASVSVNDSGIYTMFSNDSFAVLCDRPRDASAPVASKTTRPHLAAPSETMPKIIAVMLEPDGQSRFFHPEASRRAGRPVWQPLQPVKT